MYWIYLSIFILAILAPQFIQSGNRLLREEDIESLLIFCFGTLGFMIYLAKEKTFLRMIREKLHLQKQTSMITRDLTDSYSYIGEMNRKLDIVKDFIFQLPKAAVAFEKKEGDIYASLLQSASQLAKTDRVALCFIHAKKKTIEQIFEKSPQKSMAAHLDAASLLAEGKLFWEEQDYAVVRSPSQAKGVIAFFVFAKTKNHIEDSDVYKMLVSQALLLYALKREHLG